MQNNFSYLVKALDDLQEQNDKVRTIRENKCFLSTTDASLIQQSASDYISPQSYELDMQSTGEGTSCGVVYSQGCNVWYDQLHEYIIHT